MKSIRTLCQPNDRLGCSACCGLFNLSDISRISLYGYLSSGIERIGVSDQPVGDNRHLGGIRLRDETTHVCPFQGLIGGMEKPGCLAHPDVQTCKLRDRSLFQSKICDEFLCPAHELLDDFYRTILIESVDDWYAYSIAIIDPDSFKWIVDAIGARDASLLAGGVQVAAKSVITRALLLHADSLNRLEAPLFHYSVSEYRLQGRFFSLSEGDADEDGRREILLEIEGL